MAKNKKRKKLKYKKKCDYCNKFFVPGHPLKLYCDKCKKQLKRYHKNTIC